MRIAFLLAALGLAALQDPPPKAARSVHLGWEAPEGGEFANEVRVDESVPGSYFMVCGWNTGYFGLQELSGTKEPRKIVLFSVWDPSKGDDPSKVPPEKRVEIVESDPDARIARFGGEGTGAQCKYAYPWTLGESCRFLVRAVVEGPKTLYTGWFYRNDLKKWVKLVSFRVTTGGLPLRGYYSFVEDFRRDGKSPNERRRARFGPGWVRSTRNEWHPLAKARFTADATRLDTIDAAAVENGFSLATGGDTTNRTKLNSTLSLPDPAKVPPADLPAP
jgi:hypothetical protein